jgi:hypothetical protein
MCLGCETLHTQGRSFSRSYGSSLPSSLTRVLPLAWVYSTCLPVSVCGTGQTRSSLSSFSGPRLPPLLGQGPAITPQSRRTDFPILVINLHAWHPLFHSEAGVRHGVPASLLCLSTGILTRCPSPTPFGLGLGPTDPTRTSLPSEPLGFRRV